VSQSFRYIPKSGIAGSNGRSMFSFLSSLQIFFRVVVLVYIPTNNVRGFLFWESFKTSLSLGQLTYKMEMIVLISGNICKE
jgi:hypothetical protein